MHCMNDDTARRVHARLLEASAAIEDSIAVVRDVDVIGEELTAYKLAAAEALGEIWFALLKPLYDEHPTLVPPGLNIQRPDSSDWGTFLRAAKGRY